MNGGQDTLRVGQAAAPQPGALCGCCAGRIMATPLAVFNRPGLSAIAYRVGTHARFKESMLARLSSLDLPALADLRTRDDDDFTIALTDAWAVVCDVLAFYQERIAGENYLATAGERLSVLELARLIGYRLRPGVAASTYLAFTLEEAGGAPEQAVRETTVPTGTQVKSIPGPGEEAQTFETIEGLDARLAWSVLRPRRTVPLPPAAGARHLYLSGTGHNLEKGDTLLFVGDERLADANSPSWDFRRIQSVEEAPDAAWTRVGWADPLATLAPRTEFPTQPEVHLFRRRAGVFGYNAPAWRTLPPSTKAAYLGIDESELPANDPGEWPEFTIFAPVGPRPVISQMQFIGPTTEEVAMTATSAAHAGASLAMQGAAAAGMGIAASAADIGHKGVDLAVKAAAQLETVAQTMADEVVGRSRTMIEGQIAAFNSLIASPFDQAQTLTKTAIVGRIGGLAGTLSTTLQPILNTLPDDAAPGDVLSLVGEHVRAMAVAAAEQASSDLASMVPSAAEVVTVVKHKAADALAALSPPTLADLHIDPDSPPDLIELAKTAAKFAAQKAAGAIDALSVEASDFPSGQMPPAPSELFGEIVGRLGGLNLADLSSLQQVLEDAVSASGEIGTALDRLKTALVTAGSTALAQTGQAIAGAGEQIRSATIEAAKAMDPGGIIPSLGAAATDLAAKTEAASTAALEAAGASYAAALVSSAVQIAKQAPAPLPHPTPQFVADVARYFADVAIAQLGGMSSPVAPVQPAAMEALKTAVMNAVPASMSSVTSGFSSTPWAAAAGAMKMRSDIVGATEKALQGKEILVQQTPGGADRSTTTIDLDLVYPRIINESWVMLSTPSKQELYRVTKVVEGARDEYHLSGKTTRLTLAGPDLSAFEGAVRETVVFAEPERLPVAEAPLDTPVWGEEIVLDRVVEGLEEGRTLIVRGRRPRLTVRSESLTLTSATDPAVSRAAGEGTVLFVLDRPKAVEGQARVRTWRVRDLTGNDWMVDAAEAAFAFTAAAGGDAVVAEVATLALLERVDDVRSRLRLAAPLANAYDRISLEDPAPTVIYANVAAASHGETASDILGSGNAGAAFQRFRLKRAPLTHVSAASASGTLSSLEVRVDDIRWHEQPSLHGQGARDRAFVTDTADDGSTTVLFGDGRTGARLPSGQNNVRAVYRHGIGVAGNLAAGKLSLLMSRPLGVKEVVQPLPASGGADPETRDDARSGAPITVLTLERAVSLRDYADFARNFGGGAVAKSFATWSWDGHLRRVLITVAGPDGAAIAEGGKLMGDLVAALRAAGDPFVAFQVRSYRPALFRLALKVKVAEDHLDETVLAEVEAELRRRFAFAARDFAAPVSLSEVIAAAHAAPGVVAVDVDRLYRLTPPASPARFNFRLPAALPELAADGTLIAAELLTLDPAPLDALQVMP